MMKSNQFKKSFALACLTRSNSIFVHFDGTNKQTYIPSHIRNKDMVILQLGYNLQVPIPDLEFTDDGISATLSFSGKPHWCFMPWEAVFAIVMENGKGMTWDDHPALKKVLAKAEAEAKAGVVSLDEYRARNRGKVGKHVFRRKSTSVVDKLPPYLRVVQ